MVKEVTTFFIYPDSFLLCKFPLWDGWENFGCLKLGGVCIGSYISIFLFDKKFGFQCNHLAIFLWLRRGNFGGLMGSSHLRGSCSWGLFGIVVYERVLDFFAIK